MINRKEREKERKRYLKRELKEYEAITDMTEEERQELYQWVSEGHSVYDNPWYIYGSTSPMDFISAMRIDEEICSEMREKFPGKMESPKR
jgi:hypothetical protein